MAAMCLIWVRLSANASAPAEPPPVWVVRHATGDVIAPYKFFLLDGAEEAVFAEHLDLSDSGVGGKRRTVHGSSGDAPGGTFPHGLEEAVLLATGCATGRGFGEQGALGYAVLRLRLSTSDPESAADKVQALLPSFLARCLDGGAGVRQAPSAGAVWGALAPGTVAVHRWRWWWWRLWAHVPSTGTGVWFLVAVWLLRRWFGGDAPVPAGSAAAAREGRTARPTTPPAAAAAAGQTGHQQQEGDAGRRKTDAGQGAAPTTRAAASPPPPARSSSDPGGAKSPPLALGGVLCLSREDIASTSADAGLLVLLFLPMRAASAATAEAAVQERLLVASMPAISPEWRRDCRLRFRVVPQRLKRWWQWLESNCPLPPSATDESRGNGFGLVTRCAALRVKKRVACFWTPPFENNGPSDARDAAFGHWLADILDGTVALRCPLPAED